MSYAGKNFSTSDLAVTHANLSSRLTFSLEDPVDGCSHRLMYLQVRYKSPQPKPCKLARWNFKKTQCNKYSQLSDYYVNEDLVNDNPDVYTDLFVTGILRATKESIPRGQVKKHLPFWNESLDTLKAEGNTARFRAKNSHNITDCILLRQAQAKLRCAVILSKRSAYRSFTAYLDFRRDGLKRTSSSPALTTKSRLSIGNQ